MSKKIWLKCINKLFEIEGFKSDHDDDPGGKTYYGIARRYWPQYYDEWGGPPTIEQAREFYREEFWNPLRLGDIHDQRIAYEIFEQAVNLGHERAQTFAQLSNNLARRSRNRHKLKIDGVIGPNTLAALNTLAWADTHRWVKCMNGIQFMYYCFRTDLFERITKWFDTFPDSSQLVFFRGWLRRIAFPSTE